MLRSKVMSVCGDAVDTITRSVLVPWLITYIHFSLDDTWGNAVISYGFCVSAFTTGRILGRILRHESTSKHYWLLAHLSLSFLTLSLTTRLSLLISSCFSIGYTGSALSTLKNSQASSQSDPQSLDLISSKFSSSKGPPYVENGALAQRKLVVFVFSLLFSGLLYNEYQHEVSSPVKATALLILCVCAIIITLNVVTDRSRYPRSSREASMRNSSSQNLNLFHISSSYPRNPLLQKAATYVSCEYQGPVPTAFLEWYKGDLAVAQRGFGKTIEWRRAHGLARFLDTPQSDFHTILRLYPHAIHGCSRDGCVVLYELLGQARPRELAAAGVKFDDLVWHFVLRNEYVFSRLLDGECSARWKDPLAPLGSGPGPDTRNGCIMTVIDVKGVRVADISSDVISFIKKSSEIIDSHYPGRVARLVICNAPSWFYSVWTVVARVLPDAVRKKISIISGTQALAEFMDPSQLPAEYGGAEGAPALGRSPEHLGFVELANEWARKSSELNDSVPSSFSSPPSLSSESKSVFVMPSPTAASDDNDVAAEEKRWGNEITASPRVAAPPPESEQKAPNLDRNKISGIVGWVRSRFGTSAPHAYLGEKNMYQYDENTGSWKVNMSDDNTLYTTGNLSSKRDRSAPNDSFPGTAGADARMGSCGEEGGKMSAVELEEHGLVLAIQAAHHAALSRRKGGRNFSNHDFDEFDDGDDDGVRSSCLSLSMSMGLTRSSSSSALSSYAQPSSGSGGAFGGSVGGGDRCSGGSRRSMTQYSQHLMLDSPFDPVTDDPIERGQKISAVVFLLVFSMYFLSCSVQSYLYAFLPVFMASKRSRGGLGYNVLDRAYVLSAAGLVVYTCHVLLVKRFQYLLRSSPARMFRIGSGSLVVLCFIAPLLLHYVGVDTEFTSAVALLPIVPMSLEETADVFSNSPTQADRVFLAHTHAPGTSLLSIPLPAALCAALVIAAYASRKAAGILLHVALSPSFSSPSLVISAIAAIADITAPITGALIFGSTYGTHLPFPMNASFVLSVCACTSSLQYTLSLLVAVQFRGDYGVMPEEAVRAAHFEVDDAGAGAGRENEGSEFLELLELPLGDISLLLSQPASGLPAS